MLNSFEKMMFIPFVLFSLCAKETSPQDELAILKARWDSLQRIHVHCDVAQTDTPIIAENIGLPKADVSGRVSKPIAGTQHYALSMKFLRGCELVEQNPSEADILQSSQSHEPFLRQFIWSLNPGRAEVFKFHGNGQRNGVISDVGFIPPEFALDIALGIRLYGDRAPLTSAAFESAKCIADNASLCKTEFIGSLGRRHVMTFDKQKGYALTVYEAYSRGGQLIVTIENADFTLVGNLMLPSKSTFMTHYTAKDGSRGSAQSVQMMNMKYNLTMEGPDSESCLIRWPKDTAICEERAGLTWTSAREGIMTDSDIAEQIALRSASTRQSESEAEKRIREATSRATTRR